LKKIIIENIRIKLKIIDMGNIIPLRIIDIKKNKITTPKKTKKKIRSENSMNQYGYFL